MACLSPKIFRGNVVPCGTCSSCVAMWQWRIRSRIVAELVASPRSWFVTLTLRREMTEAVGYRLVQRWLKRLRKRTKLKLRYVAVAERGSLRGRLHFHVILHGPSDLTQRPIRSCWRGGISEATLVQSRRAVAQYSLKVAGYVTKGRTRMRCSLGYGSRAIAAIKEREIVREVFTQFDVGGVRLNGHNVPRKLLGLLKGPSWSSWRRSDDLLAEIAETRRLAGLAETYVAKGFVLNADLLPTNDNDHPEQAHPLKG